MERLIEAVLDLWESEGHDTISARTLGRVAASPISAIYHHFGSLERLYVIAHERALAESQLWCSEALASFSGATSLAREDFPAALAALIDDWCNRHRRPAFAWRQCQLMAVRDTQYMPLLRRWQILWDGFWECICDRFGFAGHGPFTHYMFDGESLLHLMRWRPLVDRACLDETCRGWAAWLSGRLAGEGAWRGFAWDEAGGEMPELIIKGETAERIAVAAADTVADMGISGLTHRAVAARAALTLGVVSYHFRSSAELVRAAFEIIYLRAVHLGGGPVAEASPESAERAIEQYSRYQTTQSVLPALDELLLAVARDPDLGAFAPQLRYRRGRSSRALLQALVGADRPISQLDAALFSGFISGQRRACVSIDAEQASAQSAEAILGLKDLLASNGR